MLVLVMALTMTASRGFGAGKEVRNVAMILFRGETPSEKGFKETLAKSKDYDIRFTVLDANQNKEKLKEIVDNLDVSKYDIIYTFGTMATQYAMERIKDRPIIYNVVQRPIEGGIIKSWENSGNNVTGASNIVSTESAFRTLALVMNIRKLGFLYYEKDPAPKYQKADIEKVQKKFGFKMVDIPVKDVESIPGALKKIVNAKVDAVMFPSDSFIKANANKIMAALNKHKVPSIVIIPEMVKENGALLSLGPDYYELGQLAAGNTLEVLNGRKPSEVPSKTVQNLRVSINLKTADRLGVNFPLQLLSMSTIVR
jgi:putative ABC transport system substrate-binding protein